MNSRLAAALPAICFLVSIAGNGLAQDVLLSQYDLERTGANTRERTLRPSNVNTRQFGRIFTRNVDSTVYALPLIVSNITMPNSVQMRNVLIVATMKNTLYAFDADDRTAAGAQPIWSRTLGPAPNLGDNWIGPEYWGILGTPFIDRTTNTIYAVTKVQASTAAPPVLQLNAVDLLTGVPKFNSPQNVSFPFSGGGPVINGQPAQIQRAGLLVHAGVLYVAYANVLPDLNDRESQEGFLQSYNAADLRQRYASFQSTPTGLKGGIWQAGRGIAVDPQGFVYVATAGGSYNGIDNFGSSVLKLEPRTLKVLDWFTPSNWEQLYHGNLDISANGVTVIPGTALAFAGGKEGVIYLLNRNSMGGLEGPASGPPQRYRATQGCYQVDCTQHLGTAFWSRPDQASSLLYVWDRQDVLRAYPFNNETQRFATSAATAGSVRPEQNGGPAVSAFGSDPESGVVWNVTVDQDASYTLREATLRAFRGTDISQQLYHSDENRARDAVGFFTKFAPPVIANGQVYVATHSNRIDVYGLLNPKTLRVTVNGGGLVRGNPGGIACTSSGGATCAAITDDQASVELNAVDGPESVFAGWSGVCAGTSPSRLCRVAMSTDQTVTAAFTAALRLTVVKAGSGSGNVTASAGGLDCGPTCETRFAPDAAVTLQAVPAPGSLFAGWSGSEQCRAQPECTVTLRESLTITATFNRVTINSGGIGWRFQPASPDCSVVTAELRPGVMETISLPAGECGKYPASLAQIIASTAVDLEVSPLLLARGTGSLIIAGSSLAIRASDATSIQLRVAGHFTDAPAGLGFQPHPPCRLFEVQLPTAEPPSGAGDCPKAVLRAAHVLATPLTSALEGLEIEPGFRLASPSGLPVSGFTVVQAAGSKLSSSAPVRVVADAVGAWTSDPANSSFYLFANPCLADPVEPGAAALSLDACAANIPANATALLVHLHATPEGPLERLTVWPDGLDEPASLTHLTSMDGSPVSGLSIVQRPASATFFRIAPSNSTKVKLSVIGYFAP